MEASWWLTPHTGYPMIHGTRYGVDRAKDKHRMIIGAHCGDRGQSGAEQGWACATRCSVCGWPLPLHWGVVYVMSGSRCHGQLFVRCPVADVGGASLTGADRPAPPHSPRLRRFSEEAALKLR